MSAVKQELSVKTIYRDSSLSTLSARYVETQNVLGDWGGGWRRTLSIGWARVNPDYSQPLRVAPLINAWDGGWGKGEFARKGYFLRSSSPCYFEYSCSGAQQWVRVCVTASDRDCPPPPPPASAYVANTLPFMLILLRPTVPTQSNSTTIKYCVEEFCFANQTWSVSSFCNNLELLKSTEERLSEISRPLSALFSSYQHYNTLIRVIYLH